MHKIELNHQALRDLVRFTDPFMHTMEKEEEILCHFRAGELRPPSLIKHGEQYLIFNGNHRVLVAINNELTITCKILESLDDVLQSQNEEGDRYRDISMVSPLTFEGVIENLLDSAKLWSYQEPKRYEY